MAVARRHDKKISDRQFKNPVCYIHDALTAYDKIQLVIVVMAVKSDGIVVEKKMHYAQIFPGAFRFLILPRSVLRYTYFIRIIHFYSPYVL